MAETVIHAPIRPAPSIKRSEHSPLLGILLALLAGAPVLIAAKLVAGTGARHDWLLLVAVLSMAAIALLVAADLRVGLALFILFAGLSPKLPALSYENLRLSDGIFVLVLGVWVAQCLRMGRFPRPRSPLTAPFLAVTVIGILSTYWGMANGTVTDRTYSLLIQLKRVEYFLIFWIAASSVNSRPWLHALVLTFVAAAGLTALYGLANPARQTHIEYAQARVMGPAGESYNILSGYMIVCLGTSLAALLEFRRPALRAALAGCALLMTAAVLYSFSREGLVMLLGSSLALAGTRHRRLVFAVLFLLIPVLLWGPFQSLVGDTVTQIQEAPHAGAGTNGLAARMQGWRYFWQSLVVERPLLGSGVGSVVLAIDSEYVLRACEGGLFGCLAFAWLLGAMVAQMRRLEQFPGDRHCRLLRTGTLAAFIGLLIQGLVGVSFTAIRTMEPFWFLLGLGSAALAVARRQQGRLPEGARAAVVRESLPRGRTLAP